jgi:CBS domain-containing protein
MASISSYVVRDVLGLESSATCREAADLLSKRHIGAVAVKQHGKIVGLITERDLVTRIVLARAGLPDARPRGDAPRRAGGGPRPERGGVRPRS